MAVVAVFGIFSVRSLAQIVAPAPEQQVVVVEASQTASGGQQQSQTEQTNTASSGSSTTQTESTTNERSSSSTTETSSEKSSSQGSSSSQKERKASSGGGVESPWTASGRFSTGNSVLDNYIKDFCDTYTIAGGSYAESAYNAYLNLSWSEYVERVNNQSPWGEGWDVEYALQYFEEGNTGNCYNFAAMDEYILKYFGYEDAEAEPCLVLLQSDTWGDHGLVFVTNRLDGSYCLVDAARSSNGWMLDTNLYTYDVRNINQNTTIDGNAVALDDSVPTRITPAPGLEGDG
ncbi:MAG: hypothetical protein IJ125_00115 [Atopobiaceae bacterium]|nr:hypothetical protein [Atopobiaceae bacterium]